AALGDLDSAFGTNGTVGPLLGSGNYLTDVTVDSLGRVIAVGNTTAAAPAGGSDFLVVRFNPDGSPDATFGTNGRVTVDINGGSDAAEGVAVDTKNNVIVIGSSAPAGGGSSMVFARLLASTGVLDATLGGGSGIRTVSLGATVPLTGTGVAVDASGDIVGVGTSSGSPTRFEVVRMLPSGQLDATFNGAGFEAVVDGSNSDTANGVAIDHGGNILVTGSSVPPGFSRELAVTRLLPTGAPDPAFNLGSVKHLNTGGSGDRGQAVTADRAGNVYVAGDGEVAGQAETEVVKLTAAGAFDPSFGVGGEFFSRVGGAGAVSYGAAVAVRPGDEIVVGGSSSLGSAASFYALQLTPAGDLDTSFAADADVPGISTVAVTPNHYNFVNTDLTGGGMVVTTDGRIVLAGSDLTSGGIEAARLLGPAAAAPAPGVTGVSPATGPTTGGTTVTVTGSSFAGATAVNFGSTTVTSFISASDTQIVLAAPAGATGTVDVTVVTPAGTSAASAADQFTYTAPASPPAAPNPRLVGYPEFAVGSDAGGSATVTEYDGSLNVVGTIKPFPGITAGVRTAVADFTGTGGAEIAVATGPGVPAEVKVIDPATGAVLFDIQPFVSTFTGGLFVAAGDITGDGKADLVITPDKGGGPRVEIYQGGDFQEIANFFGIDDPNFRGGCRAAVGDVNADGHADLVVGAGFGGGPRVAGYDGAALTRGDTTTKLFPDFFLFEQSLTNGVYLALGDLNGDGSADVIGGGGPNGGPRVLALDGKTLLSGGVAPAMAAPLANFFAGDPANRGGIRVAAKNLGNNRYADLVVGSGAGAGSRVTGYRGEDFAGADAPLAFAFDAFPGSTAGVYVG
ncbi:MAG TPA: IPT/TIG domain-containing protein, partial [Urbifossiella sp.]|nr:IPT/TIG domain-containing protein [Urbifossiella sp.]